jgi:Pentapeptide repeats (9 copies)
MATWPPRRRPSDPLGGVAALFGHAIDRLGDPRPAQRIGALHTLDLLGQERPGLRESAVEVLCAYLRGPVGVAQPAATVAGPAAAAGPGAANLCVAAAERSVRQCAQRLLIGHLRPDLPRFWPGLAIDLSGATLIDLDLSGCHLAGPCRLDRATLLGQVKLREATVTGELTATAARFTDHAWFERATFGQGARFDASTFAGDAWFGEVTFRGPASFRAVTFAGHAWFAGAAAHGAVDLTETMFRRSAGFRGAHLAGPVALTGAVFAGPARVSRRRDDAWNLCPPGWRVQTDPDNDSVGQLIWAGHPAAATTTG